MTSVKPSFSPTVNTSPSFDGSRSTTPTNPHRRKTRWVESVRLGLTVLTLILGLIIVGTSGNSLRVYNNTSQVPNFLLPLWPEDFSVSPTVAILAGGCVVVFVNGLCVAGGKIVAIRSAPVKHTTLSLLAPTSSLIASIIAVAFYYSINASTTDDSIQSWSCRWTDISMATEPHFKTICRESMAGLYLSILLIPLQVVVVALAALTVVQEKKEARGGAIEVAGEKSQSPALS